METTGIECNALADKCHLNIITSGVSLVIDGHTSGLAGCTLTHSVQEVHTKVYKLLTLNYLNLLDVFGVGLNQLSDLLLHVFRCSDGSPSVSYVSSEFSSSGSGYPERVLRVIEHVFGVLGRNDCFGDALGVLPSTSIIVLVAGRLSQGGIPRGRVSLQSELIISQVEAVGKDTQEFSVNRIRDNNFNII